MIIDAADQGKKKVILTMSGRLAVAFRPFFPEFIDNAVRKKALNKNKAKQQQQEKQKEQKHQNSSSHKHVKSAL